MAFGDEIAINRPWHALSPEQAGSALRTDLGTGLSDDDVAERVQRFGRNAITPRRGESALVRFLRQFHAALIYILLAAAVVTAFLGEWLDSAVILGVVMVNAAVGYVQESRAVKAIEALARTLSSEALVVRAGRRMRISAAQLAPGDVVVLSAGDKTPADLRLVEERDLRIDESSLTGESQPVTKRTDVVDEQTPLADRRNMAYASTLVVRGQALGIVVAIGDATEVGRISRLISTAEQLETPLTRKIAAFSRLLMWVIIVVAGATFAVGVVRGLTWVDTFMGAVALAVGAIPEGLPAAITIMLAIGVGRMAGRSALVRKLPAVEALGSTTVICSDKTGTLTQNQMTVRSVVAGGTWCTLTGGGYDPAGALEQDGGAVDVRRHEALRGCLLVGALCNDASVQFGAGGWEATGDPTEAALVVSAEKGGLRVTELQTGHPRIDAIPFESEHQFMATLHAAAGLELRLVCVKGSVERVAAMCTSALGATGQLEPLDVRALHEAADLLAQRGQRVLAFAQAWVSGATEDLTHELVASGLTFLGLQGMLDPPRPEAVAAVRKCRVAGVTVKMITGDHATTAESIARMVGLGAPLMDPSGHCRAASKSAGERVVTGAGMAAVGDADLPAVAEDVHVFARMTPEQKLRLVRALQTRGHVVAMTGDGVNDAPALRQADIGVAMGVAGTEVARQSADMVLADDNFSSIEAAIEEGRTVFDNLTKFLVWTMPTNGGEALIIMAALLLGTELPLLPLHVLFINMTTAVLLGMMLAFEPRESDVMLRPPRDPAEPILTYELIMRTGLMSLLLLAGGYGLFEWAQARGLNDAQARTVTVALMIGGEMMYLFNCRSLVNSVRSVGWFTNPWIWVGSAAMAVLLVFFAHAPVMNRLFQTAPLDWASWGAVAATSVVIGLIVGLEKSIRCRAGRRNPRRDDADRLDADAGSRSIR